MNDAPPTLSVELLNAIPDGVLVVDGEGRVLIANRQLEKLFGFDSGDLDGQPVEMLIPEDTRRRHVNHREGFHSAPRVRPMGIAQQLSGQRRDGSLFPVEVALSPLSGADDAVVMATVRDVTERVAAASALAESQRQSSLISDRERLARDLHDTVIQELFATGMHLQATLQLMDGEARDRISNAVDTIDEIIRHVRETIFGLANATGSAVQTRLEDVVRSYDEHLAAPATLTLSGELNAVPDHIVDQLVPTLREALSNVAQHANAREVRIVVGIVADRVQLEVRDDGGGLQQATESRQGRGLRNLAERAQGLGGELVVTDNGGRGTAVIWGAPLTA